MGELEAAGAADYALIVPAYNEERQLPGTLRALAAAMAALPERRGTVLVVDNASSDRTAELARAAGAEVLLEPHRQIARARNAGGRHARTRYLIFIDADTQLCERLLRETLAALESGRVCGGGAPFRFDAAPLWGRCLASGWNALARAVGWAAGSYCYCLREGFLASGGFDESVYASEELGFSRALKRWGRARCLRFRILRTPVITSGRKLTWFGPAAIARQALHVLVRPSRMRQREQLPFWYTRPDDPAARPGE
jgi:glycosyltransferase involved in cell wall biosynthesis